MQNEIKPDALHLEASRLLQEHGYHVKSLYLKPEDSKTLVAVTKKNGINHVVELSSPSLKVIRISKGSDGVVRLTHTVIRR